MNCSVSDCQRPHKAKGFCFLHWRRNHVHGDPLMVVSRQESGGRSKPRRRGSRNSNWKGQSVTYSGAHQRVLRSHGKASDWSCVDCGGSAAEWAYTHDDPRELGELISGSRSVNASRCSYSGDPDFYVPMCKGCHRSFDRTRLAEERNL